MDENETLWDINALVEVSGVSISKGQLERWRAKGLLPKVPQIGKGRGAGSEIRYPLGTAQQAVAIVQLLAIKEKSTRRLGCNKARGAPPAGRNDMPGSGKSHIGNQIGNARPLVTCKIFKIQEF